MSPLVACTETRHDIDIVQCVHRKGRLGPRWSAIWHHTSRLRCPAGRLPAFPTSFKRRVSVAGSVLAPQKARSSQAAVEPPQQQQQKAAEAESQWGWGPLKLQIICAPCDSWAVQCWGTLQGPALLPDPVGTAIRTGALSMFTTQGHKLSVIAAYHTPNTVQTRNLGPNATQQPFPSLQSACFGRWLPATMISHIVCSAGRSPSL